MTGNFFTKRGQIFWANLEPAIAAETKKRRPGLVVSNDIGNELSKVVIFAPITSKVANVYPFEVKVEINGKSSKIMLNQCRALDKSRLQKQIGQVEPEILEAVDKAIKLVFALE